MTRSEFESWVYAMPLGLGPAQELLHTGKWDIQRWATNPRQVGWNVIGFGWSTFVQRSLFATPAAATQGALMVGAFRDAFFGPTGLATAFGVTPGGIAAATGLSAAVLLPSAAMIYTIKTQPDLAARTSFSGQFSVGKFIEL